jgi:hypothetical protein
MRAYALATAGVLFLLSALGFAQGDKAEIIGPIKAESVSEPVRQSLENKGYRLTLADGTLTAEIWLRAGVATQPKKETAGVLYSPLKESELVGVIRFPEAATDFRGQPLAAGFYTLRYAWMPNDGNHMGAASNRDFLLLVPAGSDSDPKGVLDFQKLVALSRQASGTKHPAVLSMVAADNGTATAFTKDEEEHYVFSASLKLAGGGELPVAFVVKGVVQQQ